MSDSLIDPRPRRETTPQFDADSERLSARVQALDAGMPLDVSKVLAARAVRHLSMAENGEALWMLPNGRQIRGAAGRAAVMEELLEAEQLASFGEPPRQLVLDALADRGVTQEEAEPHLPEHRIRRQPDGQVWWTPSAGERIRIGGTEVIEEATKRIYSQVQRDRGNALTRRVAAPPSPDADLEAEVRARHRFTV